MKIEEIQDRFCFDDDYIGFRQRKYHGNDVTEYSWAHHSLIEVDKNLKVIGAGIGLNPSEEIGKEGGSIEYIDKNGEILESTRRNAISVIKEKELDLGYYLQFDISCKSETNSKNITSLDKESIDVIERGLMNKDIKEDIKYVIVGWGRKGQDIIDKKKNEMYQQKLYDLLKLYFNENKLYKLGIKNEKFPPHFVNSSGKHSLNEWNEKDFKFLGKNK